MLVRNPIERRWLMLKVFAQFYTERLRGFRYPPAADNIFAYLTHLEKQALYRLATLLPPNAELVEIGSFQGGSSVCLAAGIQQSGGTLHCIDTFMADNMNAEARHDTYTRFAENTAPYADNIQVHQGYSYDVVGDFQPPIHLLFVDGDHEWEGVTKDLELYLPLLEPGGILVMHDTAYPPVRRALEEIILPKETARLVNLPNMYAGRIH